MEEINQTTCVNDGEAKESCEVKEQTSTNVEAKTVGATNNGEAVDERSIEEIKALIEIKDAIDRHFAALKNILVYHKEKDANLNKLSAMIQDYRDGFDQKLFKSVALNVIALREDCKKAIREFGEKQISVADAAKYIGYTVLDYEDLLMNLNVEKKDGEIYYNGKPIDKEVVSNIVFDEDTTIEMPADPIISQGTKEGVLSYLSDVEKYMTDVLNNNAVRDRLLAKYIAHSSLYEQGIGQLTLYPVIRKISALYDSVKQEADGRLPLLTEENAGQSYLSLLERVVEITDEILCLCSVNADAYVSDVYDGKKQRILKTVKTESDEENGKISRRITDCYTMGDSVIYMQKVEVLKKS